MLVVSGSLIAVILAGEGSSPEPPTLAELTATVEVAMAETAEAERAQATPIPSPTPDSPIPVHLQARFDALPERLREEAWRSLQDGSLDAEMLEQIIRSYENRRDNVRFGPVLSLEEGTLRMEVVTTGEEIEVTYDDTTEITRDDEPIAPGDLRLEELIMVVFEEGTSFAESIEALGVAAP